MKKIAFFFSISLLFIGCAQRVSTDTKELTKTINTIVDNWHNDASEANYENYFGGLDSVSIFIGTDAAEVWNKTQFSDFSKPYFDNGKAWDFTALNRNVYFSKDYSIVWFDELLDTWMGLCRGSGVLEKTNGKWKIKHYVLSLTVPNDNIQDVLKVNKEADSLYKLSLKRN